MATVTTPDAAVPSASWDVSTLASQIPPRLLYLVEFPSLSQPYPQQHFASTLSFEVLSRTLLERILFQDDMTDSTATSVVTAAPITTTPVPKTTNALILHETYVIRLFQRLCDEYRVSWQSILETTRHGCCLLDPQLHNLLADIWETRAHKNVSLEEHNCYERVMGRDYVRQSDLIKLAGILSRVAAPTEPKRVWTFFGVDGYLGDDPKRYVDQFRYNTTKEWRGKHVRAVRLLYQYIDHPNMMKDTLEMIFQTTESGRCGSGGGGGGGGMKLTPDVRDTYVRTVGGWDVVKQIGEWRSEQKEKKKRGDETALTSSSSSSSSTTINSRSKKRGKEEEEDFETTKRLNTTTATATQKECIITTMVEANDDDDDEDELPHSSQPIVVISQPVSPPPRPVTPVKVNTIPPPQTPRKRKTPHLKGDRAASSTQWNVTMQSMNQQ